MTEEEKERLRISRQIDASLKQKRQEIKLLLLGENFE
jgi:hypothetical protein